MTKMHLATIMIKNFSELNENEKRTSLPTFLFQSTSKKLNRFQWNKNNENIINMELYPVPFPDMQMTVQNRFLETAKWIWVHLFHHGLSEFWNGNRVQRKRRSKVWTIETPIPFRTSLTKIMAFSFFAPSHYPVESIAFRFRFLNWCYWNCIL